MDLIKNESKPVVTRAYLALQKKAKKNELEIISVSAKAKVIEKSEQPRKFKKENKQDLKDDNEFDIKKARHEVVRFATANQSNPKNRKKLENLQAIKLGAKPQPKTYRNYKELLAERKRLKDAQERKKQNQLCDKQRTVAAIKRKKVKNNKRSFHQAGIDKAYGTVEKNK